MNVTDRIRRRMWTAGPAVRWSTYLWILASGSLICFLAMAALIAVVDPWKALPFSARIERPMSGNDQRLLYPMLLRTKNFDSLVFGSSTAMLIDPAQLGAGLGGRFINLAVAGGLPWEQLEFLRLGLSQNAKPRTLVFAMDYLWCAPALVYGRDNPDEHKFPHWLYRELSWRNLRRVLNEDAFFHALNAIKYHIGRFKPDIRDDGYWVFPSYHGKYDPEAALQRIYGTRPRSHQPPIVPPEPVSEAERAAWTFPWLDLLEKALTPLPASTRVVFVTMPVHVTAQVRPGSVAAQREEVCKQRTARIAASHGSIVIDLRIHSAITRTDENYWDALHYRLPIARQIEESVIAGVLSGQPDPEGLRRIIDAR